MIVETIAVLAAFAAMFIGPGLPIAARLRLKPAETLLAAVALSLLVVFVLAWALYVFALPLATLYALPAFTIVSLLLFRGTLRAVLQDPDGASLLVGQIVVTAWCVSWLGLVFSYSGGFWVGDWFGHWQRVMHFLERGPVDILFNGFDALTSRPPLVNIVVGAFLIVTRIDFAHYQLAMTVLGSLAFLPAAVIARRWGGGEAITVLAVLLMVNPMFIQNATYAWTKLPAAFFTLAAIYFFLRAREAGTNPTMTVLFAATLAGALLAHYSAGPYALVLAAVWIAGGWKAWTTSRWWRSTLVGALVGAAVLSLWFGWSLAVYGVKGTLFTNSSMTEQAPTLAAQLEVMVLNVRDTLVPHFLRDVDYSGIAQRSRWAWWRDWFFLAYQLNFFFTFGSITWLVIGFQIVRISSAQSAPVRFAWVLGTVFVIVLGVAVVAGRDKWGLAHICLQPVVILGLGFLAARWRTLSRGWKLAIGIGGVVDFVLGVVLHFGLQSLLFDPSAGPGRGLRWIFENYSEFAAMNLRAKLLISRDFFGDTLAVGSPLLLALLLMLLLLALERARIALTARARVP